MIQPQTQATEVRVHIKKKIIKSNPLHVQEHSLKHLLYKKKSERVRTPDLFQEANKNNKSATYPSLGITELPVD